MSEAEQTEDPVSAGLAQVRAFATALTTPDGPFPLAEEEVNHYGTIQKYKCWQHGPNSQVHLTLPALYGDAFSRFIDQDFLVYEEERLTFGDVMAAAAALARDVAATYGFERGACLAVAGRNHPDWVVSFVAGTSFLGAMVLPVNSWWIDEELRYGMEDSKTKLLIADLFILKRAPFLSDIGLPAICMRSAGSQLPSGVRTFEDAVASGRQLPPTPLQPATPNDRAMLMYTSGTTSKPKGVVLTQRGILGAVNTIKLLNTNPNGSSSRQVVLLGSPLFHVTGSHVALFAAIAMGGKLVMMHKWDAGRALPLIQQEKITTIVGVPTMTYDLVNHPDFSKYDTSSMVGAGGGGAVFAAPMIERVNKTFKNARASTGYGLTETNAVSVVMPAPFFPARPTSCGIPVFNVDVCIMDEANQKLPIGEVGEICFHGATVMLEYWGKPDKTAEVFHVDEDGKLWFRTGDLGALDKDGFVYIMDRAKDIIIRGGENISCAEVEAAVFEHPSVAEVAAIGLPHEQLGEIVAAAVVFKPGAQTPSNEELRQVAAKKLAGFKVPAEIHAWPEAALPRGATGKIQKRDIREKLKAMRQPPSSKL